MPTNPQNSQTPPPKKIQVPGVRHIVAVASGKGGVGKSTVTVNLACALARSGASVGLLDADIYGPSIPTMMGLRDRPSTTDTHVTPLEREGVRVMSMGFLIPDNQPVVWRGPMVHGALTQFLTQVDWGDLDFLLIDMPPGTGDAQLTISQNAPLSGAVIVTTPQQVSLADARKGLMMFQDVQVPILGVVENMTGEVFGEGGGRVLAETFEVPFLGALPLDARLVRAGDEGQPFCWQASSEDPVAERISQMALTLSRGLDEGAPARGEGAFRSLGLEWRE